MDLSQCDAIYREAFGDDGEFRETLFSVCGKHCRAFSENGAVHSFLFALPCAVLSEDKRIVAYYIYAAATKKEYRGTGLMTRLLTDLAAEGKMLFLKPAEEKLFGFYRRLGFSELYITENKNAKYRAVPTGDFARLTQALSLEKTVCTRAMYRAFENTELDGIYFPYIME